MYKETNYKYLSIVLGFTAIVFAVLYFTKPEPSVGDIYEGVTNHVRKCNDMISGWNQFYGSQASSSERQKALDDILVECQDRLKDGLDLMQ